MIKVQPYIRFFLTGLAQSVVMFGLAFLFHTIAGGGEVDWSYNDADHYAAIVQNGYADTYAPAFFPGFPYVWKFLGISAFAMGMLNGLLWIAVAAWISCIARLKLHEFSLGMATPMAIFYFLPYAESFFALGAAIILFALYKRKLPLLLLGVAWCSVTRPVFVVLVPAIWCALAFRFPGKMAIQWGLAALAMAAASFIGVLWFQGASTGNWLSFFEAQKAWGNGWSWPQFPLQTWGNGFNTILDASALLVAFCSGLMFLFLLREDHASTTSPIQLMALSFLAGTGLLVLLTRGGMVFSLSRFIYASPFILLVMPLLISRRPTKKNVVLFIGALLLLAVSFGAYRHIQTVLESAGIGVLLVIIWKLWHRQQMPAKWMVIVLFLVLQGYVGSLFLNGEWIA